MSGVRSASINQSKEKAFVDALSLADSLASQGVVRIPFIFKAYKDALELYQQIPIAGQSDILLAYYIECRSKYLSFSKAVVDDLIKPAFGTDAVKEQLIEHAETVFNLREKLLTPDDAAENKNQADFREQISHLKQDLEIVKAAAYWGYDCINIPKDGNCLFNAMADQLKLNDLVMANPLHDEPHHALRSLAVTHLRANRECYAVHIPDNSALSSYTTELACSGTWGDHLEIVALVRELMITLVLIQDNQNILVFKTQHPKAIFYLGYETNYHFVSLHKKDNSPLHRELAAKIENAPLVEIGPYILHAILEKKRIAATASHSETRRVVPATANQKSIPSRLAQFFKSSKSTNTAEDKSKQEKPNNLLSLITRGSSSSLGPR